MLGAGREKGTGQVLRCKRGRGPQKSGTFVTDNIVRVSGSLDAGVL